MIVNNYVNGMGVDVRNCEENGGEPGPVSAASLTARVSAILEAHGASPGNARVQAEHLVEGELRGHPSHGVRRLSVLVDRIRAGLIDPRAEPVLEWAATSALRVDGGRGFGPVAAYRAIDALHGRIGESGAVAVSLRRTHHLGMLAPYVERLAGLGCVGVVLSSTEGLVHPWGGAGALIGTNPLGIGVATAADPLVLDMSTGAVSAGRILDYRAKGRTLAEGWAVDRDGAPTTDAEAAADGAISPFGGAKGYALGLALGAMVGALTGTAFGEEVHGTLDAERETTKGDVIIALDAAALAGADMRRRTGDYLARIRSSGPDVAVPGDRARSARDAARRQGVRLPPDVRGLLDRLERKADR